MNLNREVPKGLITVLERTQEISNQYPSLAAAVTNSQQELDTAESALQSADKNLKRSGKKTNDYPSLVGAVSLHEKQLKAAEKALRAAAKKQDHLYFQALSRLRADLQRRYGKYVSPSNEFARAVVNYPEGYKNGELMSVFDCQSDRRTVVRTLDEHYNTKVGREAGSEWRKRQQVYRKKFGKPRGRLNPWPMLIERRNLDDISFLLKAGAIRG